MSEEYDPTAIYRDRTLSTGELDSSEAKTALASAGLEGVDFSTPLARKDISHDEIKEIAEQCSVPNSSLTPDQRNTIMEYQIRMGVGQNRSSNKTSTRSYHYYK